MTLIIRHGSHLVCAAGWFFFDLTVVGVSIILYVVGVVAEANSHVSSTRGLSAGLRSLVVVLRWLRALRAAAMLYKTSSAASSAARQVRRHVRSKAGVDCVSQVHLRLLLARESLI